MNTKSLKKQGYTHVVIITLSGEEPEHIPVITGHPVDALIAGLRVKFGDNRDDQLPPMLISVRKL